MGRDSCRRRRCGRAQYPSQLSEPFLADYLDEAVEMFRPAEEPGECFFGDLEVLGVTGLHIGFVENVVPGDLAMLVARPGPDKPLITIFG